MKITVLGCWGAYPKAGEATSGYLLQTDKHNILLDCGSGVLANLFRHIRPEEIDAVFLSHFHHDHCADLGCLSYASRFAMVFKRRANPMPIYAGNKNPHFSELNYKEYTVGKEINPNSSVDMDGLRVTFFQTVHEEYNLAMRFEYNGKVLVYTGDLGPTTPLIDFSKGADLIICESSLFAHEEGMFSGHMTSKESAELADKAGAKALMLTHFPHLGDINKMAEEAARYYNGVIVFAEVNKTITL